MNKNNARNRIEHKLLYDLLIDWGEAFAKDEGFVFSSAFCSSNGTIRLSSPSLESAFPPSGSNAGAWGNGRLAFYEIASATDGIWHARLSVSLTSLNAGERSTATAIEGAIGKAMPQQLSDNLELMIIKQWTIGSSNNPNETINLVDCFARTELLFFERELSAFLTGERTHIRALPSSEKHIMHSVELPDTIFAEGAQMTILSDKFERNDAARARCIAEHGAKCAICGFDFGKVYGDDYSGKIEVHHIVPLSKIRENHIVDPVNDLIPVCPNCHLILHSKASGGTFTPDEVRAMINRS